MQLEQWQQGSLENTGFPGGTGNRRSVSLHVQALCVLQERPDWPRKGEGAAEPLPVILVHSSIRLFIHQILPVLECPLCAGTGLGGGLGGGETDLVAVLTEP